MKTRAWGLALALSLLLGGALPSRAFTEGSPEAMATDAIFVRPFCLAATILGSAVFLVSLPVAAVSKSTDDAARVLVKAPARATFTRPLGKFKGMNPDG